MRLEADQESINHWRSWLVRLPDRIFFDILRNYLGPVKTPYHKPELIDRLAAFLRREEIQDAAVLLCSEAEARMISVLAHLGPVNLKRYISYLGRELPSLEIYRGLSALEDRLVIYRDQEEKLRFNPYFEARMRREFSDPGALFPSRPREGGSQDQIPWANDLSLMALFLLLPGVNAAFRQDLSPSKRLQDEAASRIPSFFSQAGRLAQAISGLQFLGLVLAPESGSRKPALAQDRWQDFLSLPSKDRALQWWAAIIVADWKKSPALLPQQEIHFYDLALIEDLAIRLDGFLASLPEDRAFEDRTLLRILDAHADRNTREVRGPGDGEILQALTRLAVLFPQGPSLLRKNEHLVHLRSSAADPEMQLPQGALVLGADGSAQIQAWVPAEQLRDLLPLFRLVKADLVLHLELDQQGVEAAYRKGLGAEELMARLERLSTKSLPQPFRARLEIWERESASARAGRGVLFRLSEERQTLLTHHKIAGAYVEVLAEGLCFIPEEALELPLLSRALEELGLDPQVLIPQEGPDPGFPPPGQVPRPKLLGGLRGLVQAAAQGDDRSVDRDPERAAAFRHKLHQRLDELGLDQDTKRELSLRVDAGLILSPEQLHPGVSRPEQTIAGSLDHTAKLRLIEIAIQYRDLLEVSLSEVEEPLLLKPQRLTNSHEGMELEAESLPDYQRLEIKVHRIRELRRLKGGLFK